MSVRDRKASNFLINLGKSSAWKPCQDIINALTSLVNLGVEIDDHQEAALMRMISAVHRLYPVRVSEDDIDLFYLALAPVAGWLNTCKLPS